MYWAPTDTYLAHHGILGMKWGVRRFQNPDGTYTSAGKARYSKEFRDDIENGRRLKTGELTSREVSKRMSNEKAYKKAMKQERDMTDIIAKWQKKNGKNFQTYKEFSKAMDDFYAKDPKLNKIRSEQLTLAKNLMNKYGETSYKFILSAIGHDAYESDTHIQKKVAETPLYIPKDDDLRN